MRPIYFYFIIFGAGVVCSMLITYFAVNFVPNGRKSFISEERYLQVRDDYSIYSLSTNDLIEDHMEQTDQSRKLQKKNKHEGETCTDYAVVHFSQIVIAYEFSDEMEALSTLKVANELKAQSKTEKALRLFKHALALAPKHPEVLTSYGEFIEHNQSDIIKADLMYFQVSSIRLTLNQVVRNHI